MILPPAMASGVAHYQQYFKNKNATRLLQWVIGQGVADMEVQFSEKVSLIVSAGTLQAIVLHAFNGAARHTVRYGFLF